MANINQMHYTFNVYTKLQLNSNKLKHFHHYLKFEIFNTHATAKGIAVKMHDLVFSNPLHRNIVDIDRKHTASHFHVAVCVP